MSRSGGLVAVGDLGWVERAAWPIAALSWLYLVSHSAHTLGPDFPTIWTGPHDVLHGRSPYPTTSDISVYMAQARPFYVHPPSAPIALLPLGLLPVKTAGAVFIVVSSGFFVLGLYRLAARTPIPALIVLGAGLSLPVREELSLGNADLLCAGLIALALSLRGRWRAVPVGAAMAIKPTAWPALALFGVDGLVALAIALALVLIGVLVIPGSGRFFHHVLPYLAHGQVAVETVRTSITDAAVATGLPRGLVGDLCAVVLTVVVVYVFVKVPRNERLFWAPLLLTLTVVLSVYSYPPYAVYVIAVLPLLRPAWTRLALLGVALYLIAVPDVWSSNGLSHALNTVLDFKLLAGLIILIPVAASGLIRRPAGTRSAPG